MTDDTGWNDFGCYLGGKALGHPTPNIDRVCQEGATFTSWYGQASCTAGRSSFMTGRIPVRTALSVVVAPGDRNHLTQVTPTIAEFYKKSGYTTYFSGKWHLGDVPESYPIANGFDEMKQFAAYYPGVYSYDNLDMHPLFPSYNKEFQKVYNSIVNAYEWEGVAGQPARKVATITYDYLSNFDVRQSDNAIAYIKSHASSDKPFFMDVNYMHMHNPTNPDVKFRGRSHLGRYSDSVLELDDDIGRVMDEIRKDAPNTIVIITADNGAWLDAYPDAGTIPFRGEKGTIFEGGFRVPGIMWWPGHIPAGSKPDEMMSHMDVWPTTAAMVGLTPPPHGGWVDNTGKPIYFDGIDNSAYVMGKAPHSARRTFVYIEGEQLGAVRVDVAGDANGTQTESPYCQAMKPTPPACLVPGDPNLNIAWKFTWNSTDSWLGVRQQLGGIPALYNLTMDPYEKYNMIFNGAAPTNNPPSQGRYAGEDNAWSGALYAIPLGEFDQSIIKYPNMRRFPGGASSDLVPNLQNIDDPVPALKGMTIPGLPPGGGTIPGAGG